MLNKKNFIEKNLIKIKKTVPIFNQNHYQIKKILF